MRLFSYQRQHTDRTDRGSSRSIPDPGVATLTTELPSTEPGFATPSRRNGTRRDLAGLWTVIRERVGADAGVGKIILCTYCEYLFMSESTIRPFFWRATRLFGEKTVVSRTTDGEHRYSYESFGHRVQKLAGALSALGISDGDRVGTFGWNHHRHFEAYYGIPLMGAQIHTINVQLSDDRVAHIVEDASDDLLLVDPGEPLATIERLWEDLDSPDQVVVMAEEVPETELPAVGYETLVAEAEPVSEWPELNEDQPAGMCYTSGTTGLPKGVEYTHRMVYDHSMMVTTPAALGIDESDVVLSVVPMFHVNSWEFPYAATMAGARQVHPGASPSAAELVDLIGSEGVTLTAGVPTVWIDVLDELDEHGGDLSSLERIVVGGSAAPEEVTRRYKDEYDVTVEHAWGMTETMSIGAVSRPKASMAAASREERLAKRAKQGLLSPGLEMKLVDEDGDPLPWDGESAGELLVRGPTVIEEYHNRPEANETDFESAADGGWLHTGDIANIDDDGYIEIVDRVKDVIKSGGEWISSIELENQLMAHQDVTEAAVVAAPHERWGERPLGFVVPQTGADPDATRLRESLVGTVPKWWLPDEIRISETIPKTATGKFDKQSIRERLDQPDLPHAPGRQR